MLPIPEVDEMVAEDLHEALPTLYPVGCHRGHPAPAIPQVVAPPET